MTAIESKVIAAISISKNVSAILDSFVAQDDICYGTQRALSSLLSKQVDNSTRLKPWDS